MSKNDVTASQEEQGEAGPDSVFDFLYHDSRRIGSFLSQFDNNGLLTAINQGESASRNARREAPLVVIPPFVCIEDEEHTARAVQAIRKREKLKAMAELVTQKQGSERNQGSSHKEN